MRSDDTAPAASATPTAQAPGEAPAPSPDAAPVSVSDAAPAPSSDAAPVPDSVSASDTQITTPAEGAPRVWVLGSLNADMTLAVPWIVRPGETLSATSSTLSPGGKGMNQAVAAAHSGARTVMIGAVGDDDRGAMLAATLERRGVGSAVVRREGVDTGTAIIQLDAAGENSIVILEGANGTVGPEDATAALAPCREGDVVVAQLEIPQEAIAAGFAVAREQGARTILNAAPAADASALLPLVDVLVVNETEAEMLLGERAEDPARRLHELHGCDVVVTLGGQGSVVLDADGSEAVPAIPTDVVDTTGAGDAFVGAAAAALAAGASLRDAARAGTRLAHEVCGVAGAQGYGG